MTKPIVQSAKLDPAIVEQLDRLVESVPLANRHAVHVACVRAGIEVLAGDPESLLAYLRGRSVRVRFRKGA